MPSIKAIYQRKCCVNGCKSNKRDNPSLNFFKLPKTIKDSLKITSRRSTWLELLGLSELEVGSRRVQVCSRHFVNSDFCVPDDSTMRKRARLKGTAVPSLHLPVDSVKNKLQMSKRNSLQERFDSSETHTEVQTSQPLCDTIDLTEDEAATSSSLKPLEMFKKLSKDPESDEESFHLPLYDEDDQSFFDDRSADSPTAHQDNVEEVQNSEIVNCAINSVKAHHELSNIVDSFHKESSNLENTAVVKEENVVKPILPEDAEEKQVKHSEIVNSEINSFKSQDQFNINSKSVVEDFSNVGGTTFEEEKENVKVENVKNELDYSEVKRNDLIPSSLLLGNKKLTVKDIEQFCMHKICQVLFYNSDVGSANHVLQKQEDLITSLRKDIDDLTTNIHRLKVINKETMKLKQLNSSKRVKNPVKVTRSVGLQVNLSTVNNKLRQRTKGGKENTLSVGSNSKSIQSSSTTGKKERTSSSSSLILLKAITNAEIFQSDISTNYLHDKESEKAKLKKKTTSTVIDLTE